MSPGAGASTVRTSEMYIAQTLADNHSQSIFLSEVLQPWWSCSFTVNRQVLLRYRRRGRRDYSIWIPQALCSCLYLHTPSAFGISANAFLQVSVVCFVLALQWAGVSKPWSSSAVIAPLVVSAVLLVAFIAVEARLRDRAMVPPRILRKKTMTLLLALNVLVSGSYFTLLYYLPIYFQAVSGVDAAESGVRTIPLVGVGAVFSMLGGIFVSLTGEYQPVALFGSALVTVGGGLLYTLGAGSDSGHWIGYQVLVGAGIGSTLQVSSIQKEDGTEGIH